MSARKPVEAGGKGTRSFEYDHGRKCLKVSKSDFGKYMAKRWPKDDDNAVEVARDATKAALRLFRSATR